MNALTKTLAAAAATTALSACVTADTHHSDSLKIKSVLSTYERALNTSNTNSVMQLYAEDGVFMPQHSLPAIGSKSVRAAYDGVFKAITLDIKFTIDEIVQVAPDWAFARTRSNGFVTIHANGHKGAEANQELFIFQKQNDGEWKISRYIFSTTNPPRQ